VIAIAAGVVLLAGDAAPQLFPSRCHDYLAAFALATIAVAFLALRLFQGATPVDWAKAVILAAAFLFWAANQYWPSAPQATLFNDIAIGLFVLDVFFVIAGWPSNGQVSDPEG
jgi:hypothetical protein